MSPKSKKIKSWTIIEKLVTELHEALENEEWELVAALADRVLMKSLLYVVRVKNLKVRKSWPHLRKVLAKLGPPFRSDYTALFDLARELDSKERYSEDESEEFDEEQLHTLCEEVDDFVADAREVAKTAGDAA